MRVIVIEPHKHPEVRNIDGYADMKKIVGGWLEMIQFMPGSCAYIDEEAKVRDDKSPVENQYATILCNTLGPGLIAGDYIANTMLIVGTLNEQGVYDGEEHDVPDYVIESVMRVANTFETFLNGLSDES